MMTFRLHLQRMNNQGNIRIMFSLEKLKDPNIAEIFRAMIGGKFAPLLAPKNQDTEIDNTAVTETANNILGKHQPAKKPWVTDNILKLCDKRRELTQKKNTTKGAKLYREANQRACLRVCVFNKIQQQQKQQQSKPNFNQHIPETT